MIELKPDIEPRHIPVIYPRWEAKAKAEGLVEGVDYIVARQIPTGTSESPAR